MNFNDRIELNVDNHIAHVVLSRADKMNALDDAMFQSLREVGEHIAADKSIRVVVMSGDGKAFCAGLDMQNFAGMLDPSQQSDTLSVKLADRTHGISNGPQYAAWVWHELEVPVIAAVHGVALGGGLQIALGADMRYAAPGTRFSVMEMRWGIVPDMSSSQRMRHLAADDVIKELSFTARIFESEEAQRIGFVTEVCEDPLAKAMDVATQIAGKNPHAIRACKRILNQSNYVDQAEGLLMESQEQDKIIGFPNQIEAVMAEMQKRPAEFED